MVRAHRQAWTWQDEWVGMTMEDIRRLEKETQEELARKMREQEELENASDEQMQSHSQSEIESNVIQNEHFESENKSSLATSKKKGDVRNSSKTKPSGKKLAK